MFKSSRMRSALTAGRRVKEAELLQSQNKPHAVDGNEKQRERLRRGQRNRDKPEEQEMDTKDWK